MAENIHAALHAVYQKVGYVQKEKPKAGGLNYSYASEKALIETLRPAMVEAGIIVHVAQTTVDLRDTYTNTKGTVMNRTCINATVRFTHAPSATFIDVQALGEGIDAGDKSTPKAMTGAYKYALREAFCIETGDDPDQGVSAEQERNGAQQPEKKQDTPEAAAMRKLRAVMGEKGMDDAALKEWLSTDSVKALSEHMVGPQDGCTMGHPHGLKDIAEGYRTIARWLEEAK